MENDDFFQSAPLSSITAPIVLYVAVNADSFLACIEQVLVPTPTPTPGDIVIMDNVHAHNVTGIKDAIDAAGAQMRYLPPYSLDFIPIEIAFSILRAHLHAKK
ncbi:hypothetical protein CQ054_21070 [Ochrobactrum sp. MYb29]|nr:hypothetical protein CWE02_09620 [Brucella pituitosa]PRA80518.1 hypothetical protein CQ054_21070 [Ochrobactrum sp. MYb29]